ncbi:MAG: phage major capsid protein [Clostridia bacterium]|nr:phage major capsid protein [Clostridia bacterium]
MTLQEIMNQITTLGGQIRSANTKLATDAANSAVPMADIEAQQNQIAEMQKRMGVLQESYNALKDSQVPGLQPVAQPEMPKSKKDMLASNEYARAFCYAIRNGVTRKNGRGNEHVKILFDALSEGGGDPAGTDGGFLVPVDIDNTIHELKRELLPLSDLFNVESVSAPTGWRPIDTAPSTPMPEIDEMGTVPNNSDQPAFGKVNYALAKRGLRIPISNELMADEDANLMAYLGRWFAKKLVITENYLLLAALGTPSTALTSGSITAEGAIKTILNTKLDPAISAAAVVITNQTGFDALDQLVDDTGRGLLQPDPTNATQKKIFGRNIRVMSDAQLPNLSTNTYAPFYVGDMKEFATLFHKGTFEVASTDVGGDAWLKDLTEVRGIARLGVSKFDTAAVVARKLALT